MNTALRLLGDCENDNNDGPCFGRAFFYVANKAGQTLIVCPECAEELVETGMWAVQGRMTGAQFKAAFRYWH
jgi:hypothetical protein